MTLPNEQVAPKPGNQDRRRWPRQRPSYTPDEIAAMRILRVHFLENYLFCLLSDGKMLCVPLAVCPALAAAPPWVKYQWQLKDEGRQVAWQTPELTQTLGLPTLLAHPAAKISALPG